MRIKGLSGEAIASPKLFQGIFEKRGSYNVTMRIKSCIVFYAILFALVLTIIFYPRALPSPQAQPIMVKVWNVDTFEGGKGSRLSFLKRVAQRVQQENEYVYFHVVGYSEEGLHEALAKGETPDILSFGLGVGEITTAQPLGRLFAGKNNAYPWCRGAYYLFSLTDNFPEKGIPTESVVISCGGNNLSAASAYFSGIEGCETDSLSAYIDFLSGKYDYLLGTQRDVCRFASRNVTVYIKELPAYCDLYQYVSVLTTEKMSACQKFIDLLLSDDVQGNLSQIGLYPVAGAKGRTVRATLSKDQLVSLRADLISGRAEINLNTLFPTVG